MDIYLNFQLLQAVKERRHSIYVEDLIQRGACLTWCIEDWKETLLQLYDVEHTMLMIKLLQTERLACIICDITDEKRHTQQTSKAMLLLEAVILKDEQTTKALLQLGADPILEIQHRYSDHPASCLWVAVQQEQEMYGEMMLQYVNTDCVNNQCVLLNIADRAYTHGKYDAVFMLIQTEAGLIDFSPWGSSDRLEKLLFSAIRTHRPVAVSRLLKYVDPFETCEDPDTENLISPFCLAACMEKNEGLMGLLKGDFPLCHRKVQAELMEAAKLCVLESNVGRVLELYMLGLKIDTVDDFDRTLLFCIIENLYRLEDSERLIHIDLFHKLLDLGVDTTLTDLDGYSFLESLVQKPMNENVKGEIFKLCLEYAVDSKYNSVVCLFMECIWDCEDTLLEDIFVEYHSKVSRFRADNGVETENPMCLALIQENYSLAKKFLCVEHCVNSPSLDGYHKGTPLHLLAESEFDYWTEMLDFAKLLLAHGANPDSRSAYGETPVIRCIRNGCGALMKLLLKANCDVNITYMHHDECRTVAHATLELCCDAYSDDCGAMDIYEMLIVGGLDINLLRKIRICFDSTTYSALDNELKNWVVQHSSAPWSLQQLCRNTIRKCMKPRYPVSAYIPALGVPKLIQEYIDLTVLDEYKFDAFYIRCF